MPGPISDEAKSSKLVARKREFNGTVDTLAKSLLDGRITLGMWEEDMRTRLRMYVGGCAVIGKGGDVDLMRPSDWGKVGAQLKKQYRWLHGFSQDILQRARDGTLTLKAVQARAHLYAEAGNIVATEIQAGYFAPNVRRDPVFVLPWIPGDGSTVCLNRCGCRWMLTIVGEDSAAGTQTVECAWVMNPKKEHCDDCIPRDGHMEIVDVPITADVPDFIGLGGV